MTARTVRQVLNGAETEPDSGLRFSCGRQRRAYPVRYTAARAHPAGTGAGPLVENRSREGVRSLEETTVPIQLVYCTADITSFDRELHHNPWLAETECLDWYCVLLDRRRDYGKFSRAVLCVALALGSHGGDTI